MAVKTDQWIRRMAREAGLIEPFSERMAGSGMISFGLQPCGYDVRLDPTILAYDWAEPKVFPSILSRRRIPRSTPRSSRSRTSISRPAALSRA